MTINWPFAFKFTCKLSICIGLPILGSAFLLVFLQGHLGESHAKAATPIMSISTHTIGNLVIVGMTLLMAGAMCWDYAVKASNRAIAQTGVPAMARIIGAKDTLYGTSKGVRQYVVSLEVLRPDGTTFPAEASTFAGGNGRAALVFPPGAMVQVFYDPTSPKRATFRQ